MSQDKAIIKKLFTVVAKQQQIITKLAQHMGEPSSSLSDAGKDITETLQGVLLQLTGGKGGFAVANARGPMSDGSVRVQLKVPANHPKTEAVVAAFKAKVAQMPEFAQSRVEVTKLIG